MLHELSWVSLAALWHIYKACKNFLPLMCSQGFSISDRDEQQKF